MICRRNFLFGLSALFLAGSVGPAPAASAGVKPFADSSRLVVIGGSLLEIVYALGEQDRVAARDTTGTWPEAAKELPDVGYMRALSPEGVLSVDPSAILMLEGSGPPEAVEVLTKASVPIVTVPERYDREGILQKIEITGAALDVKDKARALAEKVDAELRAAEQAADGSGRDRRVLFVLSVQGGRVLASGTGTAANGIIEMAGAQNAIGEFAGYKQLTDEAVLAARPDAILMMRNAGPESANDAEIFANPAIAATPAGQAHRLIAMDGAYLLGFGPRTASAIRDLSAALHSGDASN